MFRRSRISTLVLAPHLVLGQKLLLDRLYLVEADKRVEFLEGDEEIGPFDTSPVFIDCCSTPSAFFIPWIAAAVRSRG